MISSAALVASEVDWAPPLTAKLAPWMERLRHQPEHVQNWLQAYGSPVHVVVASEFKRNVKDLLSPLQERALSGGLFFARKANKLAWFVSAAKEEGIGVDTASLPELEETLALGVNPEQIVVTAIGKSKELVSLAVAQGCLLVLDNLDELQLARALAGSLGKSARIGLRLSGFVVNGRQVFSRFGFSVSDWAPLISALGEDSSLKLELLHAHLDRYDIEERACAARQLLALADSFNDAADADGGQRILAIDLGGGILMRYLDSAAQWQGFLDSLVASVSGARPSFTYQSDGLGYFRVGKEVHGGADLYPAWNNISKERFITAVLDHRQNGVALHEEISRRRLKLFFEPGRALLDNVGITLTSVTFRKRDTAGNLLIGTAMNRTNLRPFRAEFCCDPLLLAQGARAEATEGAFLVGNLCSESDLLFKRKLRLSHLPQPGDVFAFANTAGYLAHHMEIGTHGNPLPKNLLIDPNSWEVTSSA